MQPPLNRGRLPACGFALVETLLVVTLFGFGMLGNFALLIDSLRVSRNAMYRTMAVTLAADLGDRIRANRTAGTGYALDPATVLVAGGQDCAVAAPCDAAAVAERDLSEWQGYVFAALPNARTSVTVVPVTGRTSSLFTIEIRWTPAGDPDACTLVIQLQA